MTPSSSSPKPIMVPRVPFTHRLSYSFLINITWAPVFNSSSMGVGKLLSGNSPFTFPLKMVDSPGSISKCFSLMKSAVSRLVDNVMAKWELLSSSSAPTRWFNNVRSAVPTFEVRIWSRMLMKTGSVCLYTFFSSMETSCISLNTCAPKKNTEE